jgi:hypothetical protein
MALGEWRVAKGSSAIERAATRMPGNPIDHGRRSPIDRRALASGTTVAIERTRVYPQREPPMLVTIAVILLICWALGLLVFNVGAVIHVLLVIAIIVVLIRIIQGRRPVV